MGGKICCGPNYDSRWTLALGALFAVGLSTGSGFGISSALGLFFGPVHSLLPFILLGIGVDDAFIIVNAFNRERKLSRQKENNNHIMHRTSKALARAGASISVTSATDLVAFAISSLSRLPALASFCGYAAVSITFLWFYASTFFSATVVLDERRLRDNRYECFCCFTRRNKKSNDADDNDNNDNECEKTIVDGGDGFEENAVSRYFRYYHGPAILSKIGKVIVLLFFSALLAFGIYGATQLSVEDTSREFIPSDSYLKNYLSSTDTYFPSEGINLYVVFEVDNEEEIYLSRNELSTLYKRFENLSTTPPYISEPISETSYKNVITGYHNYLKQYGSNSYSIIDNNNNNITLDNDYWPTNQEDFITTLKNYASFRGDGVQYAQDISYHPTTKKIQSIRIKLEYNRLVKTKSNGDIIDDSNSQIQAMDKTREIVYEQWTKEAEETTSLPPAFTYSDKFLAIEGFKIIRRELFQNVALAIMAVGIIVLITVASPATALLITMTVAFCIIEILGFMYALGIAIDSVSVINIVLAIGLSVDYSAHVGHCFMVKGNSNNNNNDERVIESLADIGAAVLQGAISTFLAVAVLLFSKSYVFSILSKQFALTVGLGIIHGLLLLPVLLSLFGPKPFESAEIISSPTNDDDNNKLEGTKDIGNGSSDKNGNSDSEECEA